MAVEPSVSSKNTKKAASEIANSIGGNTEKTTPISKATTSQIKNHSPENKPLRPQPDDPSQPIITSADDNLETIKNNAGLLDMDVPTQKRTVNIDKDYLAAKSEVEEINDQLSAAINEVKKRNQQKIDGRQQQRNEISKDRQNVTEPSE